MVRLVMAALQVGLSVKDTINGASAVAPMAAERDGGEEADDVPESLISSIRMELVPVFTKRIFKPLICAPDGSDKLLERYQAEEALAASLKRAAEELATVTHDEPSQ